MQINDLNELLESIFAPWVKDLGIRCLEADASGARFLMPANDATVHVGKVICGQATAAAADTTSIVALSAANGRFRIVTTVDLTTHFIRPLPPGDVEIRIEIVSNGKRMAYTRAEMLSAGSEKIAVTATAAFAYLEE